MKVQAGRTERKIKEQFKKLHQFLEEEEEARMAVLRGGRGAEESDDEGEDGGCEQRDSSSFRHSQNHRGRAES